MAGLGKCAESPLENACRLRSQLAAVWVERGGRAEGQIGQVPQEWRAHYSPPKESEHLTRWAWRAL